MCITFLARRLPVRSVPTFLELLIGAKLTQTGVVTGAWLPINPLLITQLANHPVQREDRQRLEAYLLTKDAKPRK